MPYKDIEKRRAYQKQYREEHREELRKAQAEYHLKKREENLNHVITCPCGTVVRDKDVEQNRRTTNN